MDLAFIIINYEAFLESNAGLMIAGQSNLYLIESMARRAHAGA